MSFSRRRFTAGALAWLAAGRATAAPLAEWARAVAAADWRGFKREPTADASTVRLVGLPAPGPGAPPALPYAWATFPAMPIPCSPGAPRRWRQAQSIWSCFPNSN